MAYPFGEQQELHPTFLHPNGLPIDPSPYVTRFGLELPSFLTSVIEFRALKQYVEEHGETCERALPTIRQLGKIALNKDSGCWELPIYRDGVDVYPEGSPNAGAPRARYGVMAMPGLSGSIAHRNMYTVLRGEISDGHFVDHLCENKSCCWHRHLEVVLPRENNRRIHEASLLAGGQGMLEF